MSTQLENIREKVKEKLLLSMVSNDDITDVKFQAIIDDLLKEECSDSIDRANMVKTIFQSIRQNDVIQDLLDDDEITEIMINGYNSIFIERYGQIEKCNKAFESNDRLRDVIQKMVSKVNRVVNESNPIVDARLDDGSRINVVLPPISLDGPIVTIRKFSKVPLTMKRLVEMGALSIEAMELLEKLVKAKYNIFISGGTGSGKTTFLNALSDFIPKDERIITIEDAAELQIHDIPNTVRLEVRNANVEGNNEIVIRDLIKTALRMRPDRLLIGEVRDGAAVDLLNACNTGHDGSMSTGHANSAKDMISRLESMVLMGADMPISVIRSKIVSAIDVVVHLSRLRDKSRCVYEISEIVGIENNEIILNKLFEHKGKLVRTGNNLINQDKIHKQGLVV
ncbi:MAG: CpaF family protein [Lachnospiraceae bacterium]|nr:CpaF family protein [Lachnospiraceae bacterium]